ncbi:MAG TPA: MupA/Atu3671 family FMN-dependent luciferase-like monooxygenase [Ktedonobacteraceae bacterium]|nr:MupA/Atu3671 family FMN-dependent luciferase-like monooxygenase [Ktedonobacteraceae bacterium]
MNKDNVEAIYPLSPMQLGMLFHTLYAPQSEVYFEQFNCTLHGDLHVPAFQKAWQRIVDRHPVLRTLFLWKDLERPVQIVLPQCSCPWSVLDWRHIPVDEQERQVKAFLQADRAQGFDLARAPLMRLTLIRLTDRGYHFSWSFHHLLLDGWSLPQVLQEVFALYEAYREGKDIELKARRPYKDYITWLYEQDTEKAETFWRETLKGFTTPTPFNVQRATRHGEQSGSQRYAEQQLRLSSEMTKALQTLARKHQITLNTIFQGIWAIVLSHYSGEDDVLFGATVSGHPAALIGVEEMIGLFINTLPVRVQVAGESSLLHWLRELQAQQADARQYEYCSLIQIQGWSDIPRGQPLFETLLIFENYPVELSFHEQLGSLVVQNTQTIERTNYPLTLLVTPASSMRIKVSYDCNYYEDDTIVRLLGHIQTLLEQIIANPQQRLAALSLLTAGEINQLLNVWNATDEAYSRLSIHRLFEAQSSCTPEARAIIFEDKCLKYAELNQRANQLAHYLRKIGVGPDVSIGVCMYRSLEIMVVLLGVLKAGGAYVPLDPAYPHDRLAWMIEDACISVLITHQKLYEDLPLVKSPHLLCIDSDWHTIAQEPDSNLDTNVHANNLAYIIYTSGSTGKPKGVMVSHNNVLNFFACMDKKFRDHDHGIWLAVSSISFDISVLELFWPLTRGFQVIIQASHEPVLKTARRKVAGELEFSLLYFANSADTASSSDKYRLLLEGAKFADQHGFRAVWIPERHFHPFGGLYPNPSVIGATLATITQHVSIRAGSVVLPLHSPLRVAEEWAVVDNLSQGRVGLSFASGWHANDFVLAPDQYADRREVMARDIETVRELWRGKTTRLRGGAGNEVDVAIFPRPIQRELPIWLTAAGSPETFALAGKMGANLLTHLLGQNVDDLAAKIGVYRDMWKKHGHIGDGHVTLMLHTFVGKDDATVRDKVYQPFCTYLRSSISLIHTLAESLGQDIYAENFTDDDMNALLSHAFDRYYETSGLLGSPRACLAMVERLEAIGVDEVACLIDFGVDVDAVLESLHELDAVKRRSHERRRNFYTLSEQIQRHHVTHLQCTPSLASMLLDENAPTIFGGIHTLLLGGEALPLSLAGRVRKLFGGAFYNMYGPTETTIWSTMSQLDEIQDVMPIGRPLANTQVYILNKHLQPQPAGVAGELYIGGEGVVRGYLHRPELSAERFIPDLFSKVPGARLYRTGDIGYYVPGGLFHYLGRADHQIKLRGFRIEPGEIETLLLSHPGVRDCVVVAREDHPGDKRLVAYIVPKDQTAPPHSVLRAFLQEQLPEYMVPSNFVPLDALPRTQNGKLDRRSLSPPERAELDPLDTYVAPRTPLEEVLVSFWTKELFVERVGISNNFFALGGHSLLATRLISRVSKAFQVDLPLRTLFDAPTIAGQAEALLAYEPVQGQVDQIALVRKKVQGLSPEETRLMLQARKKEEHRG